ncbi:hypothetical protein UFOVP967_55 [uncultured Caudovirales phage]|uniref:Uncharacterized protein n=1 Tax=uncultured Caudovirales phage TaxID=2100421 RepID=A0A6J5QUK4_9CAUD|nr:hypothetical protein UFOVP521_61 [uncultured Caudovirales phage]CAB4167529.1 hypothetical protein UFOVP856_33 [uncultured Caudovirales phage]CAB4174507.1 hypothetical protein UFOVP967_55 [uncultured Caudovirales phage]CAB4180422.1 hypothetical protein UFOVP1036_26 [uncultured Caudovirales phage]CAB4186236.1 hypothetical protein UFOVP1132_41 [uncultured Caudovirales phage]
MEIIIKPEYYRGENFEATDHGRCLEITNYETLQVTVVTGTMYFELRQDLRLAKSAADKTKAMTEEDDLMWRRYMNDAILSDMEKKIEMARAGLVN